jgi:putative heme-binding domain-containing protein
VERIHPPVSFNNPVDLTFMPGTARLFVAEQGGKIWSFDTRSNSLLPELLIDVRKFHQPLDDVLGFTFHPGVATNRFIFINYNEPGGRANGAFVSRFTLSSLNPPILDLASERVFIRWLSGGHNGCALVFGNDGFLYISLGDAADPDPPDSKAKTGQDISDFLSSVLRIDVDHAEGTNNYSIPRDNPFVNTPGARPEVYAFGLRNPFRMSVDRATGDLWLGDVGWEQWEMIYRVKPGGNYGWSITEGPNTHVRTDVTPGPGPILPPLVALPHSEAASITGGQVYRGRKLTKLRGAYLYGDWETGKFWALRHDGDKLLSNEELCDTTLQPVAFTLDPEGELLILDYHGRLYSFIPHIAPPANLNFPRKLSETGLFTDLVNLTPATGVAAYRPAAEMWSDHARVERHLGVPDSGVITTADGRETIVGRMWDFPTNTVLARTLTIEEEKPSRRIETQLMHFDGQAWNGYSYRWDEAGRDAELVPSEGTNTVFQFRDTNAPGGVRMTPWRFQGRAECLRCHHCWASDLLSFNWLQLRADERRKLEILGLLRVKNRPGNLRELVNPHDSSAPLPDRARSWLHVNCAGCHRNGAGGAVAMHLNFDKPLNELRALEQKPTRGDFGLLGARVIAAGDPFRSTLLYRITTEGSGHMPHIGSRLVDEEGLSLVREWIRSLPPKDSDTTTVKLADDINHALKANDHATLLSSMNGALALANSFSNGPALRVPRSAIDSTNALVRELFQRFLPPDQRRQTLGSEINPKSILALRGDATHGKEIFHGAAQCARCHVCAGAGRAYGPDLTGISKKYNRAQTLEQILNPSKVVAPEFKTMMISLRDSSELTGFILKRTATELVIRDETLAERTLKTGDVQESRESALSAMPEGMLAPLTAQEAADLVEFLFTTVKPLAKP